MEFKKESLKLILLTVLLSILVISAMVWKFSLPARGHVQNRTTQNVSSSTGPSEIPLNVGSPQGTDPITEQVRSTPGKPPTDEQEDAAIQQQLDHDHQQQKQTKDLRIKLEQTNLELEEEKAIAQINKLKKENRGAFDEPAVEGQKNLPEIKVDYIGGSSLQKEAIVSIGGVSYRVKEQSSPADNIQVVAISDSSVVLHFSAPQDLTKTIDYKPE